MKKERVVNINPKNTKIFCENLIREFSKGFFKKYKGVIRWKKLLLIVDFHQTIREQKA